MPNSLANAVIDNESYAQQSLPLSQSTPTNTLDVVGLVSGCII